MATIEMRWTPEMLKRFKRAYNQAVKDNADVFTFEGNAFVRDYAKYLIEYIEGEFGKTER